MGNEQQPASLSHGSCAFCKTSIGDGDRRAVCPECRAEYHAECWDSNGGCAVYGCPMVPPTVKRDSLEISPAFWGQEYKSCPVCQEQVLAAAIRCRKCGAVFAVAQPESSDDFRKRVSLEKEIPKLRRGIVWRFIFSIFPFTAPIAAIYGMIWHRSHKTELKSLTAFYEALHRIALGVGLGQTIFIVIIGLLFWCAS